MAKIPTGRSTSQINDVAPRAKVDPNVASTGGRMFFDLGAGLEKVASELEAAHSLAERTKAENHTQVKLKEIELRRANDPDISEENHKKYLDEADQVTSQASEMISLPYNRDIFKSEASKLASISKLDLSQDLRKKTVSEARGNMDLFLDTQYQDFISTENPKRQEMAILRRDRKIDQMAEAGFITREEQVKMKTELPVRWNEGYAKNQAYSDPEKFLRNEAAGYFKGMNPKSLESLRTSAERLSKKNGEEEQKNIAIRANQGEESIGALMVSNASNAEIIQAADLLLERGEISKEHYNIAKESLESGYGKESKVETFVGLMEQYSKITQEEDPVLALRNFRNEVLVKKGLLSERQFKQFVEWSGSKQIEMNSPKLNGLEKLMRWFKGKKGLTPEQAKNLVSIVDKYMTDAYKPDQITVIAGKKLKVIKQDDGSIAFEDIG